jgi:hypothetical protein
MSTVAEIFNSLDPAKIPGLSPSLARVISFIFSDADAFEILRIGLNPSNVGFVLFQICNIEASLREAVLRALRLENAPKAIRDSVGDFPNLFLKRIITRQLVDILKRVAPSLEDPEGSVSYILETYTIGGERNGISACTYEGADLVFTIDGGPGFKLPSPKINAARSFAFIGKVLAEPLLSFMLCKGENAVIDRVRGDGGDTGAVGMEADGAGGGSTRDKLADIVASVIHRAGDLLRYRVEASGILLENNCRRPKEVVNGIVGAFRGMGFYVKKIPQGNFFVESLVIPLRAFVPASLRPHIARQVFSQDHIPLDLYYVIYQIRGANRGFVTKKDASVAYLTPAINYDNGDDEVVEPMAIPLPPNHRPEYAFDDEQSGDIDIIPNAVPLNLVYQLPTLFSTVGNMDFIEMTLDNVIARRIVSRKDLKRHFDTDNFSYPSVGLPFLQNLLASVRSRSQETLEPRDLVGIRLPQHIIYEKNIADNFWVDGPIIQRPHTVPLNLGFAISLFTETL